MFYNKLISGQSRYCGYIGVSACDHLVAPSIYISDQFAYPQDTNIVWQLFYIGVQKYPHWLLIKLRVVNSMLSKHKYWWVICLLDFKFFFHEMKNIKISIICFSGPHLLAFHTAQPSRFVQSSAQKIFFTKR